jgi:hypothetical protein
MKKGILYINFTRSAEPIADHKISEKLLSEYSLVETGTQNKQFNTSNYLVFCVVVFLCAEGKIIAEKVIFMHEGRELEMIYKPSGSVTVNLPITRDSELKSKDLYTEILKTLVGF